MEKKTIKEIVLEYFDWTGVNSISDIKEKIQKLESLGATHIEIEPIYHDDYATINTEALIIREETDEEFNSRINKEKLKIQEKEEQERKEFERLSLKYGNLCKTDGFWINRKTKGLPDKTTIMKVIVMSDTEESIHLCEWNPSNKDNILTKGFLGTATVIENKFKGIGFHAWQQNASEFIYYQIIE